MLKQRALGSLCSCAVPFSRGVNRICIALAAAALALLVAASSSAQSPDQGLERQRLRLEIERLQRESGWQADVQRWLPAASVLVAVVVAGYGVWRYFDERRRERSVRTEEGVSNNLDRLVDRPPGATNLNARAIVALRNLNALAPAASQRPVGEQGAQAAPRGGRRDGRAAGPPGRRGRRELRWRDRLRRRRNHRAEVAAREHRAQVTEAVTALVRDDLKAFHTTDDARFPIICVEDWEELKRLIETDSEFSFLMLERYLGALNQVAKDAPAYVRNVKREDARYNGGTAVVSPDDLQFFAAIVAGFERFVLVAPQGDRRDKAIRDFSDTAPKLGPQLFPSGPVRCPEPGEPSGATRSR